MKIAFDLHTHTRYSHGKDSVAENVAVARSKGLAVGISDHGPGHLWFGVRASGLRRMREDIEALRKQLPSSYGNEILQGIEGNLMNAKGDTDIVNLPPLDYHLVGYHKGIFPLSTFSLEMRALQKKNPEKARQIMTDALIQVMEDPRIDGITHPGEYIPVDMPRLARVAADKGVLIELNNKHPMSMEDARAALDAGAIFLLSSDAHRSLHVGIFDRPLETVRHLNIPASRIANAVGFPWPETLRLSRLNARLTLTEGDAPAHL